MIETVLAVLIITSVFLALFNLAHLLTKKILLEHAAMRVARARTVGLNDFMCRKAARVAVIPVAGERIWPTGDDALDWTMELYRVPDYMASENEARARAILEYENWCRLRVDAGDGTSSRVSMESLSGRAGIEQNASYYMLNGGL